MPSKLTSAWQGGAPPEILSGEREYPRDKFSPQSEIPRKVCPHTPTPSSKKILPPNTYSQFSCTCTHEANTSMHAKITEGEERWKLWSCRVLLEPLQFVWHNINRLIINVMNNSSSQRLAIIPRLYSIVFLPLKIILIVYTYLCTQYMGIYTQTKKVYSWGDFDHIHYYISPKATRLLFRTGGISYRGRMMKGHLQAKGVKISKSRIGESLQRVCATGHTARRKNCETSQPHKIFCRLFWP